MRLPFGTWVLAAALVIGTAVSGAACGNTTADADPTDGGSPSPETGTVTPPPTKSGLPCAVDAVLANNCRKCHSASPQFGAPMPLVTHEDLVAPAPSDPSRKVYELVVEKTNPGAKAPMPQPPNAPLSAADKKTLDDWVASGAPKSNDACTAPEAGPPGIGVTCKPDLAIGPGSAYEMPSSTGDEYVCYGVELTRPTPTHITGFVPRVDNTNIVHHIVLFEADKAYSPTPTKCSSGGSLQWRMVFGWAPGAKGMELPPEAGFPIKTSGSTHYVVQMHYSNPLAKVGQKDTSGFDLCTGPPRPNEADVLAFGTQSIDLKKRSTLDTTCSITIQSVGGVTFDGIHLIAAMPHMHQLGTEMSTMLTPAGGGAKVDLGTDLKFTFQTQTWYPIGATKQGHVIHTGDQISTRCKWVNTTDNDVKFGENTADEMCYSFTLYYPKVPSAFWSWAAPSTLSQCQ